METNPDLPAELFTIWLAMGSEPIRVTMLMRLFAAHYGFPLLHGRDAWFIEFDAARPALPEADRELLEASGLLTSHLSFIPAKLPDEESLRLAQRSGKLWFMSEEDLRTPGVRGAGSGSGARPDWGLTLYRSVRRQLMATAEQGIRTAQSQPRHMNTALNGQQGQQGKPVHLVIIAATPGATGNGSIIDAGRDLRGLEKQLRGRLYITLYLIDMDTIRPVNYEVACRNRSRLLAELRAVSTGRYRDPEGLNARSKQPLFDNIVVSCNAGPDTELPTLTEQLSHAAHQLLNMFCTPMGRRMRERKVDLDGNCSKDPDGTPRAASVMGWSAITVGYNRYRKYCSANLAHTVAKTILAAPPGDAAAKGTAAATSLRLVESDSENQALRRLTKGDERDLDAFQETREAYEDRLTGLWGWRKLVAMVAALRDMIANFIGPVLPERFQRRAGEHVQEAQNLVVVEQEAFGKGIDGLSKANATTQELLATVEESDRSNAQTLTLLSQASGPVFQQLDDHRQQYERLTRMSWLRRLFFIFTVWYLARRYHQLVQRALQLHVELTARETLHGATFLPLADFLKRHLGELTGMEGNLQTAAIELERTAEMALSSGPSILREPVSVELSDADALKSFYERAVLARGGESKLIEQVFAATLKADGSLLGLLALPSEEIARKLSYYALAPFEDGINALNVCDVLQDRHGKHVETILDTVVKEAGPRLRSVGEADMDIACVRVIGVPKGNNWQWLRTKLIRINQAPDNWILEELPAHWGLMFMSYRADVSLNMLIKRHPVAWSRLSARERIQGSPNKIAALFPQGDMTETDARVVAIYGLASGVFVRDAQGFWLFKGGDGQRKVGKTASDVLHFLRMNHPDAYEIYSLLGERGQEADGKFLADIQALGKVPEHIGPDGLITPKAMARALDEVENILPYLKNIQREA